jgi:uncharacterized membrane protein YcaP (DUF421 family)
LELYDLWETGLGIGLEAKDINAGQMALRAVAIYISILVVIRLAKKRFLANASAFDVVVGIIIGSIASRAITGNAPMIASLAASTAILALHWLFSAAAVRSHRFGELIKGSSQLIVENGVVHHETMRRVHMTERDLEEALRKQGVRDASKVAEARLERDGSVSVIKE